MKKLKTPLVLAVDFDGVIAQYDRWKGHNVMGPPIRGAIKYLKKLREEGWIVIVWTTRPETVNLKFYLSQFGIEVDGINKDVKNWYDNLNHKIFAHVFLDDRDVKSLNKRWSWWKTYWRLRWKNRHLYERVKK